MPEPISYTLRFPAPQTHYVEVEALVPTEGRPEVELLMAVWTPGSYMVREFARNLETVTASSDSGEPLPIVKTSKNRWRVESRGPRVTLRYKVYSREMSVRTNFVDEGFAILNGAPTFLTVAGGEKRPHDVRLVLPPQWRTAVSPLPGISEDAHAWRAADFDTLVDSPIYAGNAPVYRFEVAGRPHLLVNEGEGNVWDGPRSAADVERIARELAAFWGVVPYERYVFFNLITEAGGGLEHRDSCVLMTSRWKSRTREDYNDWLSLVSHELFHAWNVKRLRPAELGPFDYEGEVYTRSLWFAEGVTSYYDELLVHRAGMTRRDEYLKKLSKQIETLQTTPGRLIQPLAESSFDAWIKYYRRDENSINTGISYYIKGSVVAFLLDARIRSATGGRRSLDDVLRLAWQRHSGERGFQTGELRAIVREVAGSDLDPWMARALESAEELDYTEALAWYGLRFVESDKENGNDGKSAKDEKKDEEPSAWLGIETEVQDGRVIVTQVKRETPAYEAGLNVGDELIAVGDYRVPPDGWKDRLRAYRPGQKDALLVARRERLVRLPVVFGEEPRLLWKLEPDPEATVEQRARLEDWLRGSEPEARAAEELVAPLAETELEESHW
ncbi:MAG TPA: PDZ domain-containing protein [Thermoanaerobaculia bacterium]|nr:PDZ domain-containing protein [Thermoanaerobaculia bacterium]